jgi:phosphoenolpyruvate carboxykinase (GTP)
VNWLRQGADDRFLWPGFGDNSRVLKWAVGRAAGVADAVETPVGLAPAPGQPFLFGPDVTADDLAELFEVDPDAWQRECDLTEECFAWFGDRLPAAMGRQLTETRARLG